MIIHPLFFFLILLLCSFVSSSSQSTTLFKTLNPVLSLNEVDRRPDDLFRLETPQFNVIKRIERKSLYYTQGLVFKNSTTLIESAGLYGESGLHFLNIEDFANTTSVSLADDFFGEGCTLIKNNKGEEEIYQLTWRERKIFVYDGETLSLKRTLDFPEFIQEGWGLSHQVIKGKTSLFLSDGSSKIFVLDPETLQEERTIQVTNDDGNNMDLLNELEFVGDVLLANVYLSDVIVAIDVSTGKVIRTIDLSRLVIEVNHSRIFRNNNLDMSFCLNGIAFHKETNCLIVTGKKWPYAYQIELKEAF